MRKLEALRFVTRPFVIRLFVIWPFAMGCANRTPPSSLPTEGSSPSQSMAPGEVSEALPPASITVVHSLETEPAEPVDRDDTGTEPQAPTSAIQRAVHAPDRSAEDRALDPGRHPEELLSFIGVEPGMVVLELGAGTGYTTELLARVVGEDGKVYAQNPRFVIERFADEPLNERLAKPALKNVTRVDREFDDPVPEGVRNLDAVVCVLFYHDTIWMGVDRSVMNRKLFEALKPGGLYVIVDHSARKGAGTKVAKTLHRVEESIVIRELTSVGFELARRGDFLTNPEDSRDWNASPGAAAERRGTSDRFVLAFVKPGG